MRQAVSRTPNVGPGTYASLRLKLDAWPSAGLGGQGDKNAAHPPEGSLGETRCLIKGPSHQTGLDKSIILGAVFVAASHQTRLDKSIILGWYLSLPPTTHDLTQGQKPEGRLKWG